MAQIILDSNNNLIQGDFDNATLNNRTKLQTTTTNATTNVYIAPNGSSTSAGVSVANNSSLTNASKIVMATNGTTDTQIISGVNGSGSYLPLSFYTNNALAAQLTTAGNLSVTGTVASSAGTIYPIVSGTAVTLSGTSISLITGIPTWAKRITLVCNGVVQNSGSANILIQLNGVTTGYNSIGAVTNSSAASVNSTAGLVIYGLQTTLGFMGSMTILNQTGNTWVESHSGAGNNYTPYTGMYGGGVIALASALSSIAITTSTGTAALSGSITVLYE